MIRDANNGARYLSASPLILVALVWLAGLMQRQIVLDRRKVTVFSLSPRVRACGAAVRPSLVDHLQEMKGG
jgi:hypothetical protein